MIRVFPFVAPSRGKRSGSKREIDRFNQLIQLALGGEKEAEACPLLKMVAR
jgi:hypothetical protein